MFPLCAANGISQIVWSPLAQGVLSGKYRPGARAAVDSRAASELDGRLHPAAYCATTSSRPSQRLKPIAADAGLTLAQLALAWVLRKANVASAIIGASRPEQVHENAAASGVTLGAISSPRSTRRSTP